METESKSDFPGQAVKNNQGIIEHYMKSKRYVFLFTLLLISLILSPHHIKAASQKMQFTAEVAHARVIIVDTNFKILQIISNTKKDVEPTVRIGNGKGPIIGITEPVITQYEDLKPTLNFSKIGVVYDSSRLTFFGIKLPESVSKTFIFINSLFTGLMKNNKK